MTKYNLLYIIAVVLLFAFASPAMATELPNPGTISGETFTIEDGETLTIEDGETLTLDSSSLIIENGGSLIIETGGSLLFKNGYIGVDATAGIENNGNITIEKGMLQYKGTINNFGTINNLGTIISSASTGKIYNYGTISNSGMISNSGTINNYGTIDNSGTIYNYYTINNYDTIDNSGTINNYGTITIFEDGNTFDVTTGNSINYPPTADASGPYTGAPGVAIDFDGSKSSDSDGIQNYEWDFGDGNYGTGNSTTHTYEAAGTYSVILTVTDNKGCSVSDTTTATITDPDNSTTDPDNSTSVPEFPTIALPMVAIIGISFVFMRRKE